MTGQTLPRQHRCDANIGYDAGAFGFTHVICQQTVGTRSFISSTGLRVAYCAIDGHEANVRRRFAERDDDWRESDDERAAEMWQRMNPS